MRPGRGRARLERVLGPASSIEPVLEGLLVERGLREPFEDYEPPEPSLEGRVDLRELMTFTIDPDTAKDFDDAISARREGDGIRVWIHIADVSWFVPAGSPLDRGAARRALSTYVPGMVAPMLPHEIADDLCSLRPHEDRLTVTVEIGPDGEPNFYRSVIRSAARLTYGQAEAILAGREKAEPELAEALRLANDVSTDLRRRRFARGALRIESPDTSFEFDGKGGVARAWKESEPAAHALIEELMILANEAVAEFLSSRRREALYRVHERPDPQSVSLLLAKLAALEIPTPPEPDQLTPQTAAEVAAAAAELVSAYVASSGRGRNAFPSLVLRALKQARYDPANLGHSGLASPAYCHFTSPIRRYPDLVVHRALLRELGVSDDPPAEDLHELADHCSVTERDSAKLEYLADEICLAWLLEARLYERGWEEPFEGEIVGAIGSGNLRPLRGRLRSVSAGAPPARRLLRAERHRHRARRPPRRRRVPARRPDQGPRGADRASRGQGRGLSLHFLSHGSRQGREADRRQPPCAARLSAAGPLRGRDGAYGHGGEVAA